LTPLITPAKRLLLKLAGYPRYGPVALDDPQDAVEVWLRGPSESKNVTRNNVIAALRPLTIGIMFGRNESQPQAGQHFRLSMHDRRTPQHLLGALHLRLVRTIELTEHRFCLFELDGSERKLIAEYSKGMRKRVAMAASLIHHPDLFLMDEPFEGVDAVGARLMKDILVDQVRRGATIFLTSHVLEVVERLCDRVAIINEGKVVIEGTLDELRAGSETLEDVFVRVVGAEKAFERLEWL